MNSDYIVYVDESGDANVTKIDPQYPIFVLTFCIFEKQRYAEEVSPRIQKLKFKHFNHDNVVLHEMEIRKPRGQFGFLKDPEKRREFHRDLAALIEAAPMTIIACVIRKDALKARYVEPVDPYELALEFCLERTSRFLNGRGQGGRQTFVLVEGRGKKEDDALELAFRRLRDSRAELKDFELMFAAKGTNLGGMQLADLTARPIGLHVLRPGQENRAFQTFAKKIRRGPRGFSGYGLKVFP